MKRFWFIDWIFPSNIYCISCEKPIPKWNTYSLCSHCLETLKWNNKAHCVRCGKPLQETYQYNLCFDCMKIDRVFDVGFSCLEYEEKSRKIIFDFKYHDKTYLANNLSKIMCDRIKLENLSIDYIAAVPMSKEKKRRKGYNHATVLADKLSEMLNIPTKNKLIIRKKSTRPLNQMSLSERESELKDAFGINKNQTHLLAKKNILLIDDIFTTGSTANACSQALKENGAEHVYIFTLAAGRNSNYNRMIDSLSGL